MTTTGEAADSPPRGHPARAGAEEEDGCLHGEAAGAHEFQQDDQILPPAHPEAPEGKDQPGMPAAHLGHNGWMLSWCSSIGQL